MSNLFPHFSHLRHHMVNKERKNEGSNSQPNDSEPGINKKESTHNIVDVEPITITAVAMDAVQRLAKGEEYEKPSRSHLGNRKTLCQEDSTLGHPQTANQTDDVQAKRKRGRPRKSNTDITAKVSKCDQSASFVDKNGKKLTSYKSKEKYVPMKSTNNSDERGPCGMESSMYTDSQPNRDDSSNERISRANGTMQIAYSLDDLSENNKLSDRRTPHSKRKTGNNTSTKNSNETYKGTNVPETCEDFDSTCELPGEASQKKYTSKTLTQDTAHLPKYNRKHKKLDSLICEHCNETFKGYARLILHMNEKHAVPFTVSICTLNSNLLFETSP